RRTTRRKVIKRFMSINTARNKETLFTDIKDAFRDSNVTPFSIISASHFKHIFSMSFFEPEKWYKKFTHMSKKISSKFNSIKEVSRSFSSIYNFNPTKYSMQLIYKRLVN